MINSRYENEDQRPVTQIATFSEDILKFFSARLAAPKADADRRPARPQKSYNSSLKGEI